MSQEVQVSIICNVFNHEKYLRDALDGFVKQQTTFPFEVLIHDDASTDGSTAILKEYEEKYPHLFKCLYQTENQYSKGARISRDFQASRATGKYIAICEGDDYWTDPLKLQKQFDFMEANPDYTLCVCSTDWLNMLSGRIDGKCHVDQDRDISLEEIILEENGRIFQLGSVFMRRDVWDQWPDWRAAFPIGDLPTAILAALHGKVRMLADVMTVYRWYASGSWTSRMDTDEHRARVNRRMVEGFEALNEATNYEHNEVITKRMLRHQYSLAVMTHDLKAIKSGELGKIYRSRKWYYRVAVTIRCKFPRLYSLVLKPIIRVTQ